MKLQLIMCVGILCGVLCSCNDNPAPLPTFKHYITKYQNPTAIYVEVTGSLATADPVKTYNVIKFQIRPYENTIDCITKDLVDDKKFEELATQYKDNDFNKPFPMDFPIMYIQTDNLNVVSDNYYDAAHPAGTSLNDLCEIQYICCDNILKNPYNFEPTEAQKAKNLYADRFEELISDFNKKKPTLMAFYFWIQPIFRPEISGTHSFTITYKNVEGKVLSVTTEPLQLVGRLM